MEEIEDPRLKTPVCPFCFLGQAIHSLPSSEMMQGIGALNFNAGAITLGTFSHRRCHRIFVSLSATGLK